MAQIQVNVGATPDDGTGDSNRAAWITSNLNAADAETRLATLEPPASFIEILTAQDLDDLASGGVITVSSPTTFVFKAAISTSNRFSSSANLTILGHRSGTLTYTGTGTLFTSTAGFLKADTINLVASSTGTLLAITTTGTVDFTGCIITGWALGQISAPATSFIGPFAIFRFCFIADWSSGLLLKEVRTVQIINCGVDQVTMGSSNSIAFNIVSNRILLAAIHLVAANLETGESLARIDPDLNTDSKALFSGLSIIGGELFDMSGDTGSFTAVADAAISSISITSVTDSSGVARFNFTPGPTLFVKQEMIISGFTTNTAYNVTRRVTTVGAGFFEIASVVFGTDEAIGSFDSNVVTITDTTTIMTEGSSLTINTDFSTDYDGGAAAFNVLTNSFQINRTFIATESGSWSKKSLDHIDPRVLVSDTLGQPASNRIGSAFVNSNTTANGAIVNNTFTDMTFGTGGSALISASNTERFKLIDEIIGTFEYTGLEPFDGTIILNGNSISSGGNQDFRFKFVKDTGSGFADLTDSVEQIVDIGSSAQGHTLVAPIKLNAGDQVKPQVTRNAGSSGITHRFTSINATQA